MSLERLTEGEKMVWAAVFARSLMSDGPLVSAKHASEAVVELRGVQERAVLVYGDASQSVITGMAHDMVSV